MLSRRNFLFGVAGVAVAAHPWPAFAKRLSFPQVRPELTARARATLDATPRLIANRRRMVVVDFSRPSSDKRFHLVDLPSGWVTSFQVSHGRGSDPQHSGLLQLFSNEPGSEASSASAYVLRESYLGKNGRSPRLEGVDPTNSNAMMRGIVIHAAAYAEPETAARMGKLGRCAGCFAVAQCTFNVLLDQLSPGCLLYCNNI